MWMQTSILKIWEQARTLMCPTERGKVNKRKGLSLQRTWHVLYSTTVKWSSTASREVAELIVNVGDSGRGEQTL